jgi:flagellar basal body rod protein FlgF
MRIELFDAGLKNVAEIETDVLIEGSVVNEALEDVEAVSLTRIFEFGLELIGTAHDAQQASNHYGQ